jgi:hypothetical protein
MTGLDNKLYDMGYFHSEAGKQIITALAQELFHGEISRVMLRQEAYHNQLRLMGKPSLTCAEGEAFQRQYHDCFRLYLQKQIKIKKGEIDDEKI